MRRRRKRCRSRRKRRRGDRLVQEGMFPMKSGEKVSEEEKRERIDEEMV